MNDLLLPFALWYAATTRDAAQRSIRTFYEAVKITTSKLAQKLGMKTNVLLDKFISSGYIEIKEGKNYLTVKGKEAGGEFKMSQKYGPYFIWPANFSI